VNSDGATIVNDGTLTLASGDDGIHADTALTVSGGETTVSTSYEGLESAALTIAGGTVSVTSSDDGLNASSGSTTDTAAGSAQGGPGGGGGGMDSDGGETLTITGGTLTVDAGGDGLDSNGSMSMSGGTVTVYGPTDGGNGALDSNGTFVVSGGTLIAIGSAGMIVSPDADSDQGWISAVLDSTGAAGSTVTVTDGDGNVVAETTSPKEYQSVVVSTPDLEDGASYTVDVDGTQAATATEGTAASGSMGGGGMRGGGGQRPA